MNWHAIARQWTFPLVVILIAVTSRTFLDQTEMIMRYDRDLVQQGEWWRLLSGHLLHLTWMHMAMNIAGLLFIFYFFGNLLSVRAWLGVFILSSLFIAVIIYYSMPELRWYVGLSGVLHALFVAGGIADLRVRRLEAYLFLAFIAGKLLYEMLLGPLPGSEESAGGPVLVEAHFYGAIAGLIFTPIFLKLDKSMRVKNSGNG